MKKMKKNLLVVFHNSRRIDLLYGLNSSEIIEEYEETSKHRNALAKIRKPVSRISIQASLITQHRRPRQDSHPIYAPTCYTLTLITKDSYSQIHLTSQEQYEISKHTTMHLLEREKRTVIQNFHPIHFLHFYSATSLIR